MIFFITIAIVLSFYVYTLYYSVKKHTILTGAFLGDTPSKETIKTFKQMYGKKPYYVLLFTDWEKYPPEIVLQSILSEECCPVITWEPWYAKSKEGIPYQDIMSGKFDTYIDNFAQQLSGYKGPIYLRFAHEMNGNWYPWSSALIGHENYKALFKYVRDRFTSLGVTQVRWIFSINWENVPQENDFTNAYPGDAYVDAIGLDGYNWGTTLETSRWMNFREIFGPIYRTVSRVYDKTILITEFSSTSTGGNKSKWILNALSDMKKMNNLKGFILFNVDKETDWKTLPAYGEEKLLSDSCFVDQVYQKK